jgi:lipid-A-disaccharide synthase
MLPVMASLAPKYPGFEFVIAGAPSLDATFYHQFPEAGDLRILFGQTHELLRHAHAALVTSGTATLETALFGVPQVVCYQGGAISYAIARRIVDVKFISLPNLVMDQQLVKELIQHDFNASNLEQELNLILEDSPRNRIISGYRELRQKLGGEGASKRAAGKVMELLKP